MLENIILNIIVWLALITTSKYLIYLAISPFYKLHAKKYLQGYENLSKTDLENRLRISVVVPAWNEEVGILDTINSLLNSTFKNLEVIIVNDGSTDKTHEKVTNFLVSPEYFGRNNEIQVKYFYKENGGKGSALNYGIKRSSGDVIVTVDADTIFKEDALYQVAKYFINSDLDAGVGNVKIANSKNILGIVQQIEYIVGFYFKRAHSIMKSEYIIGGAFGIFRKDVFEKYGYFDTNIKTEDIELSTRLQSYGCKIFYVEDAIAYTEGPSTFTGLQKQRLRWKKGRLDTFRKHRDLFFSTNKKHHKFLTLFLLPITLFYEIELLFEPLFTIFGVYYLYTTQNFDPLIFWILFTGIIYFYTFLFGSKENSKVALVFVPVYFFLSYILTFIEVISMYKSVIMLFRGKDVVWQAWSRRGLNNV